MECSPSRLNKLKLWVQYEKYPIGSNNRGERLIGSPLMGIWNSICMCPTWWAKHQECLDLLEQYSSTTLPRLFTTMVHPHLEYGHVICYPSLQRHKMEVEQIQRRVTKLILNLRSLPYRGDRLEALRLPSLCYHRRRGNMLQVHEVLLDRLESNQFFSLADISNARGHSLKLVKYRSRSSLRQNVFNQRVTNDWNSYQHT